MVCSFVYPANPVITSATTTPITTLAGTSFSLNCIATGPAETVLKWYLNDTLLDPDSDPAVMIDNDGTLTVISPGISYTGAYTCNVSTSFTFVLSRVNVIVGCKFNFYTESQPMRITL